MFGLTSLSAVVVLALICVFGPTLRPSDEERTEIFRSIVGGSSAAYVFVVLLPKLAAAEGALQSVGGRGPLAYVIHHSYLLALVGLLSFWALERLVFVLSRALVESHEKPVGVRPSRPREPLWHPLLYLQGLAFAGYTMLVGYLVVETADGRTLPMLPFAVANGPSSPRHDSRSREPDRIGPVIKNEVPSPKSGRFRPFFGGALGYTVLVLVSEQIG